MNEIRGRYWVVRSKGDESRRGGRSLALQACIGEELMTLYCLGWCSCCGKAFMGLKKHDDGRVSKAFLVP